MVHHISRRQPGLAQTSINQWFLRTSLTGMDKSELRARIRARRATGHAVAQDFPQRVIEVVPPGTVCCYAGLPGEPPTTAIIEALLDRGDDVYLPVTRPAGVLTWVSAANSRPWDAWGVAGRSAPSAPGVDLPVVGCIIVPALAVDRSGRRLGQGGGYYDRFVSTRPGSQIVALVWTDEVLDEVPAEPHDVHIDSWVAADG